MSGAPKLNVAAGIVRVLHAEAKVRRAQAVVTAAREQLAPFPVDHPFRTELEKVLDAIEKAMQ